MVPNQDCRKVENKQNQDFLTQLYPEMGGNIFVDLAVDENGLWAIMAMKVLTLLFKWKLKYKIENVLGE